jgi:hypothetical protein
MQCPRSFLRLLAAFDGLRKAAGRSEVSIQEKNS